MKRFDNISFTPYWWEAAPRPFIEDSDDLPSEVDVVVVGTGFTGVNAALTLSRGGRNVISLDAADIGFGASTRNGGQIGPGNQKFSVRQLVDMFGKDKALKVYREGNEMLAYFKRLIYTEGIACDLQECGRFRGAVTAKHYDAIARELEDAQRFAGVEGFVVPGDEVHTEIESDEYVGAVVLAGDGGVHPGRFHNGLLARARQSGARFFPYTTVNGYRAEKSGLTVFTSRGRINTRDIILATNGYTGNLGRCFRKKIIPLCSAIIATQPLPEARIGRILPGRRVYGETRRVINYFRPSPDGRRVLFGGRCFTARQDHLSTYRTLYKYMVRILPDLQGVSITHGWSGYVGMSRDQFPHIGVRDGVHYAMGYSGTGVTRSTYFGHKIALKVLGDRRAATQFDDIAFNDHGFVPRLPLAAHMYIRWLHLRDLMDR